jgi:hypothetical protein
MSYEARFRPTTPLQKHIIWDDLLISTDGDGGRKNVRGLASGFPSMYYFSVITTADTGAHL